MSLTFVSEDKKRVQDVDSLQDIKPTENRVVFVDSTANGNSTLYNWNPDGDASNHDGEKFVKSLVDGYKEGDANEGVWERGILPVEAANTDQLSEGTSNKYFTDSRARDAVDPDIYESSTRLYVDIETGTDPAIDYDPSAYDVLPGRNEARAFKTIGRAVEEIRENIRPEPSSAPEYVTNTPQPITVSVAAGNYTIDNPISVPKRVSIQGDGLRTTLVEPQNPKADMFHVRSRNFFQLFRFKDIEHPAFVFSFPSVVVETDNIGGQLDAARIIHSPYGYECDYDEVFKDRYPNVESEADRPAPVRENQLVSVDPSGNDEIDIYKSTSDGSGGFEWVLFASTSAADQDLKITSNNIILPLKPEVKVSDPRGEDQDDTINRAQASITIENGKVSSISVDSGGSGYIYNPTISIAAPARKQPYIIGSPYLYNSSTITGPFTERDQNGDRKEIPETMPLPYDTNNPGTDPISGETITRAVDKDGSGGGSKIDGRVAFGYNKITENNPTYKVLPSSPLKSMVAAQFTQVNQGGPGHLLQNDAFGQYVSCFTTFSNYSYRCQSGGFALLSNSVTDFGEEGLVSEGKLDTPYTTGDITTADSSFVSKVEVLEPGQNYDTSDTISISSPQNGGTSASVSMTVDGSTGEIESVTVDSQGSGYEDQATVSVSTSTGSGATFNVDMDRVANVNIENLDTTTNGNQVQEKKPIQGTAVDINGKTRDVAGWTARGDGTYDVTFVPGVFSVSAGTTIEFYQSSRINSSGHAFEFPGSGTTYNALPEYGGVTDSSKEIIESGAGNVFITSSDQRGNFRVGNSFKVNQTTGTVTLDTDQFSLSGLQAIGPFKFDGNEVGVQLQEVTNDTALSPDSGKPGNSVPTVSALEAWVPGKVFNVLDGQSSEGGALIGRDNITIEKDTSNDFNFDFEGLAIQDSGSPMNDAQKIKFGSNLSVTNQNDEFGDPTIVKVDGPSTTDDISEGSSNLYYTSSRVYSDSKSQLTEGTDIGITANDTNETLEFSFTGNTGAILNTGGGVPDPNTGSDGNLYIDIFAQQNGVEINKSTFRKVAQDVIQTPGKYVSKEVDYERNIITIKLDISSVSNDI